jgi:hypothetical protein
VEESTSLRTKYLSKTTTVTPAPDQRASMTLSISHKVKKKVEMANSDFKIPIR